MTTFNLPDLGEGLTEATLLSWLVTEGSTVAVDQPIAEVETAKSAIEVPCPFEGTVATLHGDPGEILEVGKPLITVTTDEAEAGALPYAEEERAGASMPAEEDAASEGSGNVLIGYGTSPSAGRRRRRRDRGVQSADRASAVQRSGEQRSGEQEAGEQETAGQESAEQHHGEQHQATAPRVSSPLVRRLARERGITLADLSGSGPGGLIMRTDVLAAAEQSAAASPAPRTELTTNIPAGARTDAHTGLPVRERVAVAGLRKAIATKLSQSRREIPEATVWQDVDITTLLDLRAGLKAAEGQAPSVLAFLSRFVIAGLQRFPVLNSRIEDAGPGQEIVQLEGINLGFAAQTDAGLVVPVMRGAHGFSARELDSEIRRLADSAREGRLTGKELSGSTFTVNNYGVFGSDGATPIINYPEAAILGISRIRERPWVVDGELAVRRVTTLTIAFDHRICDGAAAGGFLDYVATCMENPGAALVDL